MNSFFKGLHPRTKTEIKQNVFPYKVHAHAVISFIHYYQYHALNLLPPQFVHARNSLLLCIVLLCTKTPQTRVKRFLSTNQVLYMSNKMTNI